MWRKEPAEFLAYHRGTMESISAGVESAMRTLRNSPADRACMLRLLCTLSDMVPSYRRGDACEFLEFGPALIPSSPLGLRTLRVLRADASAFIQEQNPLGLCAHEPDSMLGKLAHAFAESKGRSALVQSLRNDTSKSESGFRFNVSTDARAFASMPRGEQAPAPILSPALVGYEITDAREFQDECGMCEEGTLDFLRNFNISHDTEGGSYECDSCGHESEDCEEESVCGVETFTLTEEMVEAIEDQGFGDKAREYIGAEGGSDWSALLDECDDSEILARSVPDEKGIRYEPDVWEFSPDFEAIDGLESLEWSEQARALPLVCAIAARYAEAHTLPPLPGVLVLKKAPHENPHTDRGAARFLLWDAHSCTLTHPLGGSLSLRIDTRTGAASIMHAGKSQALTPEGGGLAFNVSGHHAGEQAKRTLALFQGGAQL